MVIKITPYSQAFPDSDMGSNSNRCHLFAQAGIEYLRACAAITTSCETYGFNLHVELPLMHQAIELLVKAHAARSDRDFNPKKYSHRTGEIIRDYAARVPFFSLLLTDSNAMDLIAGLEASWLSLRYAESIVEYTGDDYNSAGLLANSLSDEYFRLTGVRLQSHHFQHPNEN